MPPVSFYGEEIDKYSRQLQVLQRKILLIAFLIEGKGSSTFTWSIIGGLVWLGLVLLVVLVL